MVQNTFDRNAQDIVLYTRERTSCNNTWENGEIQNTCWYLKQKEGEGGRDRGRERAENEVNTERISQHNAIYFYDFWALQHNWNSNKYSITLFFAQQNMKHVAPKDV